MVKPHLTLVMKMTCFTLETIKLPLFRNGLSNWPIVPYAVYGNYIEALIELQNCVGVVFPRVSNRYFIRRFAVKWAIRIIFTSQSLIFVLNLFHFEFNIIEIDFKCSFIIRGFFRSEGN